MWQLLSLKSRRITMKLCAAGLVLRSFWEHVRSTLFSSWASLQCFQVNKIPSGFNRTLFYQFLLAVLSIHGKIETLGFLRWMNEGGQAALQIVFCHENASNDKIRKMSGKLGSLISPAFTHQWALWHTCHQRMLFPNALGIIGSSRPFDPYVNNQ